MNPDKTSRKNAAIDKRAKLALDKRRHIPVPLALPCEKRFQVSGNDAIEWIFFRIARPVDLVKSHRDIAECKILRNCPDNRTSGLQGIVAKKSG
jgi:hypothetical protein